MTNSKKILSLCVIILLFMAAVTGLYWDNYFFIVKKTKVNFSHSSVNASIKEEAEQKAELVLGKLQNQNIWRLNLEEVRAQLLTNKWIETLSVERELPSTLKVQIQFKKVMFLFVDSKQRLIPISSDGEFLNPIALSHAPDVPLIKNASLATHKENLKRVTELYLKLPSEGVISSRNVAVVDWSDTEGFKVELVKSEDGFIVLGLDQVSMKAKRVESVLKYLGSQKQRWRVIDASFSKKVLVRLRKRS